VLIEQKEQRRPIGALLVERQALNEAQLRQHLERYFELSAAEGGLPTSAKCPTCEYPDPTSKPPKTPSQDSPLGSNNRP
jgi:hypothetical protein